MEMGDIHLSVYEAAHFRLMIFDAVELVVGFLVVVLVAYLDCTPLNFVAIFALVIVFVNYLQPMMMVTQLPIAVNAAGVAVAHAVLWFFARIAFVVCYCYPCLLWNRDVNCCVAGNRANWFVN